MNTSNVVVDIHGLAKFLRCSAATIQKTWRAYPHFFIGLGKTAKSARFDITDVIWFLKNRDYQDGISRSQNEKMGGRLKGNWISQKKETWISNQKRSKTMGNEQKRKSSESTTGTDPIDDFRSMFAIP